MNNLPQTEICTLYGISRNTLQAWFKRGKLHYDKKIRIFTPIVVSEIFNTFGNPTYNEKGELFKV